MKVILNQYMANELLVNEDMIRNQTGPYSPQFRVKGVIPGVNLPVMGYVPVIKCFPFEPFTGQFPQEREVTPGMENEVEDIALAIIDEGKIRYQESKDIWKPGYNAFTNREDPDIYMKNYSILIYRPDLSEKTIFMTSDNLGVLFNQLKEYKIVGEIEEKERSKGRMSYAALFENIDNWFKKFQGVCTYILFKGDSIWKAGKFENKVYW